MRLEKSQLIEYSRELINDYNIKYLSGRNEKSLCLHYHTYYEMVFIVEGRVSYQVANEIYTLRPGDMLFLNIHEKHFPQVQNPDALYERITFQIRPEKLEALSRYGVDLAKCFKCKNPGVVRFPYYVQNSIRMILGKIIGAKQEQPFGYELLEEVYITELFVKITEFFPDASPKLSAEELPTPQLLNMVDQIIMENIDQPICIEKLANFVCMNKYSFMRCFKQLSGCTVYQYIINKRLEFAESLIRSGATFSSAAEKSGFSDYSCFYRSFTNKHKISPQKYFGDHSEEDD